MSSSLAHVVLCVLTGMEQRQQQLELLEQSEVNEMLNSAAQDDCFQRNGVVQLIKKASDNVREEK